MSRFQTRATHRTDPDYWLRHCTGYTVYSEDGRVGVVDEVEDEDGAPARLSVRSGLFQSSVRTIEAREVAEVVPGEMRLLLRHR